jgi:O-methyltransferase
MPTDPREYLESARLPAAAGPGRSPEELRTAYLDLLKLCLTDLAGTGTTSVGALPDGGVVARELHGDGRKLRSAGMDWPLHGLTMVGLRRLDDLQTCVESVVADDVEGDLIEAGAWRGGASILMRATLDTLGDARTVWVADSFEGFAGEESDPDAAVLSAFDFLAAPVDDVRESFERFGCAGGVELVPGYFDDTLPALTGRRWATVRLDADTYEATRQALACLYPGLARGGYLIVDDYASFEGCRRAVDEFRAEHGIEEPLEEVDFTCARWRRTSEAGSDVAPAPASGPPRQRQPRPRGDGHVPTARELDLERELAELRRRLEAAEAALAGGARVRARNALRRLVRR